MMVNQHYAAIDQGTTSTRVIVFGEDGRHHAPASIPHKQITPNPGWVEHDALEILANIRSLLDHLPMVDAIGLAHQGESLLAWDAESGLPLYNAIVWQDQRTDPEIQRLKREGVASMVIAKTGLPLDPYFSASKMGWLMKNVPQVKQLAQSGRLRLSTMDAFFLFHLSGQYLTDYNSASRTSLFNIHTLTWDEELCRLFAVPMEALPEVRDTIGHFGNMTLNGKTVPLTACIVDQFASTYGHGCAQPGQMKITFGTGAFLQAISGSRALATGDSGLLATLCWKLPGATPVYGLDGGVYNAASAINWARKIGLFTEFDEFGDFSSQPAIARGLAFVPALSGLACPYWDRSATGLLAGLSLETERLDLLQSILEGIALRTAEVISAMDKLQPIGDSISVDGGLSANRYFIQFLATMIQKRILSPVNKEITAQGVALLARKGLGIEHPLEVTGASWKVTEPADGDITVWLGRYQEIIARSRGLRLSQETYHV